MSLKRIPLKCGDGCVSGENNYYHECQACRRRIYTVEKAKVVAAVWGEELIQCLAAQLVLPMTILKNSMNSSFSFKSCWGLKSLRR